MEDSLPRIAVIDPERCKPSKCQLECRKVCPVVSMGKECIEVKRDSKQALISESLCNGCGMCVKRCPFQAIQIERIPRALLREVVHKFGENRFQVHRLPVPRGGHVLGLIGVNGIGKSTLLKIMAGKLKPNFGNLKAETSWKDILKHFRGSEWQNIFQKMCEERLTVKIKPQSIDSIVNMEKWKNLTVDQAFQQNCSEPNKWCTQMDLTRIRDRKVSDLSGGECQRLAIGLCLSQEANMFLLDEPSSYLDIRQRIMVANVIRETKNRDNLPYMVVVEHDLSLLDYMSETICCLYGKPGVYGVVTKPFNVREGINHYLEGFIPTENLRFRKEAVVFKAKMSLDAEEEKKHEKQYSYASAVKYHGRRAGGGREQKKSGTDDEFKLTIEQGTFSTSRITVFLGENGTGKSTMLKHLLKELPLEVSYKPQQIMPSWKGTVQSLFDTKIPSMFYHENFQKEVVIPLSISSLLDRNVQELSGGELQRVGIVLALGKPVDVYLLDEPSAYLDCEQRIVTAQVIKRFILQSKKIAFVVEHDFIMLNYLGDQVVVFEGTPGKEAVARSPRSMHDGISTFLKSVNVTIRRDPTNFRPRINKLNSAKDQLQKKLGVYFDTTLDQEVEEDTSV